MDIYFLCISICPEYRIYNTSCLSTVISLHFHGGTSEDDSILSGHSNRYYVCSPSYILACLVYKKSWSCSGHRPFISIISFRFTPSLAWWLPLYWFRLLSVRSSLIMFLLIFLWHERIMCIASFCRISSFQRLPWQTTEVPRPATLVKNSWFTSSSLQQNQCKQLYMHKSPDTSLFTVELCSFFIASRSHLTRLIILSSAGGKRPCGISFINIPSTHVFRRI